MATKFCDSSARLCCGWTQAASGAAGWANVGLCPASSILHIISTCVVGGMCVCVCFVSQCANSMCSGWLLYCYRHME